MKSLIGCYLLILLNCNLVLADGAAGSGGGGDIYSSDFIDIAKKVAQQLEKGNVGPRINNARLKLAIQSTHISSKDRLELKGFDKDAINYPDANPPQIIVSRSRWSELGENFQKKSRLVLHEYLGILKLDDSTYQLSSQFFLDQFLSDDYQGRPGKKDAPILNALRTDSKGNVYAFGTVGDSAQDHWIVRKSSDRGNSWQTVDDFHLEHTTGISGLGTFQTAIDTNDNVYALGEISTTFDHKGTIQSVIRKSSDKGASWQTISSPLTIKETPLAIAAGLDGKLFLVVHVQGQWRAEIRKSHDGGLTWNTLRDIIYPKCDCSVGVDKILVDQDKIFVFGSVVAYGESYPKEQNFFIERSLDSGAKWDRVTGLQHGVSTAVIASNKEIFVTGNSSTGVNDYTCRTISKSSDSGKTWVPVDRCYENDPDLGFHDPGAGYYSMSVKSSGEVLILGGDNFSGGSLQSMIRSTSDFGSTIGDFDRYVFAEKDNQFTVANSSAIDAQDNLYAGYSVVTLQRKPHWIVRRFSAK